MIGFGTLGAGLIAMSVALCGCKRGGSESTHRRTNTPASGERTTMPTSQGPATTTGPLAGIFPPSWTLGQEWRVVCKTEIPKAEMWDRSRPPLGDVYYRFRVIQVPDGSNSLYGVEVVEEDDDSGYALYFRPSPFSIARIDEFSKSGRHKMEDNKAQPFLTSSISRLILEFPAMPPEERPFDEVEYKRRHVVKQKFESIPDGVRITLEAPQDRYRVVFIWKKGQPWWSAVEQSYLPYPRDAGTAGTFVGSGQLL